MWYHDTVHYITLVQNISEYYQTYNSIIGHCSHKQKSVGLGVDLAGCTVAKPLKCIHPSCVLQTEGRSVRFKVVSSISEPTAGKMQCVWWMRNMSLLKIRASTMREWWERRLCTRTKVVDHGKLEHHCGVLDTKLMFWNVQCVYQNWSQMGSKVMFYSKKWSVLKSGWR